MTTIFTITLFLFSQGQYCGGSFSLLFPPGARQLERLSRLFGGLVEIDQNAHLGRPLPNNYFLRNPWMSEGRAWKAILYSFGSHYNTSTGDHARFPASSGTGMQRFQVVACAERLILAFCAGAARRLHSPDSSFKRFSARGDCLRLLGLNEKFLLSILRMVTNVPFAAPRWRWNVRARLAMKRTAGEFQWLFLLLTDICNLFQSGLVH